MYVVKRTAEAAAVTHAALLDAVLVVVARQGYTATRLEDVAAQAGVTRGALYHHFRSKAELFAESVATRWGQLAGDVFGVLDGAQPPLDRLERFVAGYVERVSTDIRFRELLEVVVLRTEVQPDLDSGLFDKQQAIDAWLDALLPVLDDAYAAGALRSGLDARAAAADVVIMLNGVTVTAALAGSAELLDAARIARTVVRGLAR
jgi:TetR/AcrR family acrAB operon transcriptional repressor